MGPQNADFGLDMPKTLRASGVPPPRTPTRGFKARGSRLYDKLLKLWIWHNIFTLVYAPRKLIFFFALNFDEIIIIIWSEDTKHYWLSLLLLLLHR